MSEFSVQDLVAFLSRLRLPLNSEKELQAEIERKLVARGFSFSREHKLSDQDIPDFFFKEDTGGVAVEIKIKGSRRAIYDQCARYCRHADVTSLVLVTNIATGFPTEIEGRPCYIVRLGRAWL